jgi:tetratricopeptide (TPR) repeat protein
LDPTAAPPSDDVAAGSRGRWLQLALVATVGLVYANALGGPFVFDDRLSVLENSHVRSLWPLTQAMWAEYENPLSGRPIPALSLALNYAVGGFDASGYKAVNLALHLLCGLALFALLRRTLRLPAARARFGGQAESLAFAASLLWCVHPLASEAVNYVTQRTESFMALFLLLALLCTARAMEATAPQSSRWRVGALLACAAGMASKEVMVVAPLLIVLYEHAYSGRGWSELLRSRRSFHIGLLVCWAGLAVLMMSSFRTTTVGVSDEVSALDYLLNQCWVIPRYFMLAMWPQTLSLDWGVPRSIELAEIAGRGAALVVLAGGALALWWRRPAVGFPLVVVFVVLAPTSSLVPILTEVGAERRMYVPLMALVGAGVVGAHAASVRAPLARGRAAVLLVAALALVLGLLTSRRNAEYGSERVLWEGAVAAFPANPRARASLGKAHKAEGDLAAALVHFRDAVALDPGYAEGHNELGITLIEFGQRTEGLRHFEAAIAAQPDYARPYYNRGLALLRAGDRKQARASLRDALRRDGGYRVAYVQLSWLLATDPDPAERRPERAVELARRAIELGGPHSSTLDALAAALAASGDLARAEKVAKRAHSLAIASGDSSRAAAIGRHLAAYRRGEAWVDSGGASD